MQKPADATEEPSDESEQLLLKRAMAGERDALDDLFAAHLEPVHDWVRKRLGPQLRARVDTQDLAQSSLAEAFRDLQGFEWRGSESFSRWLRRIVENKIRQKALFFRRLKRDAGREIDIAEGGVEHGVEVRTPSHILDRRYELEAVERALAQLPENYQQVVRWARLEHLPYREIGTRLGGRSEDAVRKLLVRALIKLTALVESESKAGPPREDIGNDA